MGVRTKQTQKIIWARLSHNQAQKLFPIFNGHRSKVTITLPDSKSVARCHFKI
jgi:hypothetical protein